MKLVLSLFICRSCFAFSPPLQALFHIDKTVRTDSIRNKLTYRRNSDTINAPPGFGVGKRTIKSCPLFSHLPPHDDDVSRAHPYSNKRLDEKIDSYFSSSSASSYVSPSGSSSDSKKSALKEAEELRRKAKLLKAEAAKAESELKEQQRSKKDLENAGADSVIDELMLLLDMKALNENNYQDEEDSKDANVNNTSMTSTKKEIPENESITNYLRKQSLSRAKMMNIVKRLHERELLARGEYNKSRQMQPQLQALGQNPGFVIGDIKNTSLNYNPDQVLKLLFLMNCILVSQSKLDLERVQKREEKLFQSKSLESIGTKKNKNRDIPVSITTQSDDNLIIAPSLRLQVKELRRADREAFQRLLQQQLVSGDPSYSGVSMDPYVQTTMNGTLIGNENAFNVSKFVVEIISQPMWVPQSMLGFVIKYKDEISKEDLRLFRSEIIEKSKKFYCTSSDSTNVAAVYRGNLQRGAESLEVWNEMNEKLQTYEGENEQVKTLKDRIQLFWINDPEWIKGADERYPAPKPVLFVTGARIQPMQSKENDLRTKVLMAISVFASLFGTFVYGISCYALNPTFFNAVINDKDLIQLVSVLPISFGIIALQVVHELAHFITAKKSNLSIGLPVPLPSFEIGTFGSITPLRSFPSTRTQLFDFAISGPGATFLLSLVVSVAGIIMTIQSPADLLPSLPVVPVALFKSSLLIGSIVSFLAPKIMLLPLSQGVPVHPFFLIGFAGLISSSLNMLPIGRLDGGRIATALFGRRTAYPLSFLTLLLLAISSLTGASHLSILFGLFVTVFQRQSEVQVRDEVTEVEGGEGFRLGIYSLLTLFVAFTLIPFPGGSPL